MLVLVFQKWLLHIFDKLCQGIFCQNLCDEQSSIRDLGGDRSCCPMLGKEVMAVASAYSLCYKLLESSTVTSVHIVMFMQ